MMRVPAASTSTEPSALRMNPGVKQTGRSSLTARPPGRADAGAGAEVMRCSLSVKGIARSTICDTIHVIHVRTTASDNHEALVRAALARHYSVPVLRVDDGVLRVPAGHAVERARAALVQAGIDDALASTIVQPIVHDQLTWNRIPEHGVTLWREHGVDGDEGEIVTQLIAGDPPLQIVADHDGWQLVRTLDGATGWIPEHASLGEMVGEVPAWPADVSRLNRLAFVACAKELVGIRYVWGGTTSTGIDCSGLVQRAAWNASRVWLPRHSTALLRVGTRVSRANIDVGDVLVLKRRPSAPAPQDGMPASMSGPSGTAMHVAIAVSPDELIHASRDAWSVVTEARSDVEARYQVLSVRRLAGEVH